MLFAGGLGSMNPERTLEEASAKMFLIIGQINIQAAHSTEFEQAYGPHEAWAVFFSPCPDFLGTRLFLATVAPNRT
jgi:hypothetical protein